eukprot:TRINITY_DN24010_c0_g1_i1.p1 TRINITY_DN24010_c0_g1~~TRINITY_DN24010_c0_g1_i1.p1  ORF type:complete len:291 (-),score=33.53 TRINITY_DN24010_c0_g1_i1:263-1135(-)
MNHIFSFFGNNKEQKTISSDRNILNISGGDLSKDGMAYGFSLLKGKRANMEDFHYSKFLNHDRVVGDIGCFGIYDGHGGAYAADYTKDNLITNMLQHHLFESDTETAIVEAYLLTDERYLAMSRPSIREDGCTAVTALVKEGMLYVANVGDSKCILCREGKAIQLSVDHKAENPVERQRIENAGGVVIWVGTWRVGGVLAVSRAIGDRPLKKFVTAEPHVKSQQILPCDDFVILASDGLWDVVGPQGAIDLIRNIRDPETAASKLTHEAYKRGSADNISCVVIRFGALKN